MKKFKLLFLFFALVGAMSMQAQTYADANFAIDFRTDPYSVTSGSLPEGTVVVGSINTGDANHGYRLPEITIPVTAGNYKVTMGTCRYSNQDGTVENEDNSVVYATWETNTGVCYHQNTTTNVVSKIFTVPSDQLIKVYGAEYTPYFAIEKMAAAPAFTDFEINFQSDPYSVASGSLPTGTAIDGSFHDGQHGYQNVVATVPLEAGNYRLTLGACGYGNGAGNVMSETHDELAAFNQKLAENTKCYDQNPAENIVSMIFAVAIDQTVTIDCGTYTPYMKLEQLDGDKYYINFKNETADVEGAVPAEMAVTKEAELTLPTNKNLYKAGYTLTGWTDGINTYAPGASFTPTSHMVLTAVFTANTVAITDAVGEVSVRWYFGKSNGAPDIAWQNNSGYLIAQTVVGGNPMDVRLDIDATAGKFSNAGRSDHWAQINNGTILTFPGKAGASVTVESYNNNPSHYAIDEAAGTLTCNTNDYYSYLEVTYPASELDITANTDPEHPGVYYSTFFDGSVKYRLPNDGTEAYAAEVSGDAMYLHKIAENDDVLPAHTAVILKANDVTIALTPSDEPAVSVTATNHLRGVDADTEVASVVSGTCYVLSGGTNGVGFYLYQAPNTLKAHKAYIDLNGSGMAQAPRRLRFVFNAPTGVEKVQGDKVQCTKVIENGQVIIIRNGRTYSAQGQLLK